MDPFHDRASGHDGVDEDEYDYDLAAATVSDGFRPTRDASPSSPTRAPPQHVQLPTTTSSPQPRVAQYPGVRDSSPERPSSTAKDHHPTDSLALNHDGPRPLADAPQLRPQSPYRGPSAPSHPYQSYLQRTLSNATSSTTAIPSEQSYNGPRGPAHPYAQYSQSVIPHGADGAQQQTALGHPGPGSIDPYRRQLGPDGEEAGGLIGPLGHTEELPPYSRYPDQAIAPKTVPDPDPEAQAGAAAVPAPQPVTGAGGIGVATQNPEFSSAEEEVEPIRSRVSTDSRHEINTAAREVAEKPLLNKWQRRAKKKLCGIVPYWAICLVLVAVLLTGVILGAVIGTVLLHGRARSGDDGNATSIIFPPDVLPFNKLPYGAAPPAMGRYILPFPAAYQQPRDCIANASQASAWNCDLSSWNHTLTVLKTPSKDVTGNFNMTLTAVDAAPLTWGLQPFRNKYAQLRLVQDVFNLYYDAAWWASFSHNKTVILPADSLSPPDGRQPTRRQWLGPPPQRDRSAGPQDGDTAWLCTWPETDVEIFIYPIHRDPPPRPSQSSSTSSSSGSGSAVLARSPNSTSSATTPTHTGVVLGDGVPLPQADPSPLPTTLYPYAVKLVERRHLTDANSAHCWQVAITGNAQSYRIITHDLLPVEVDIAEKPIKSQSLQRRQGAEPGVEAQDVSSHQVQARNAPELTDCACLWWP